MENNPFAPPKARVADVEPDTHGLKRRGLLMMILFTIITLGVYYPIWWFRRRPGLNRLNSPQKLAIWPLVLFATLFAIQLVHGFLQGLTGDDQVLGAGPAAFISLFQLVVGIVMIIQSFKVKSIIEDHATPEPESAPMFVEHVKLSGIMTFFFSIFYLQWAINRHVVGS